MKKVFSILMALLTGISVTYSQVVPGTAESMGMGGGSNRGITANGLTQLYSVTGKYTLSADGAGSQYGSYTIDVNKPGAGAVVHKAYLIAASTGYSNYVIPNGCVGLNANPVNWNGSVASSIFSWNHYADVTSLVAPIINPAAAGITSLTVTECDYYYTDGIALLVIFSDPAATSKTIVIMFGALSTLGDSYSITLGSPIDPNAPGVFFDMGLGISFGYQIGGGGQYSIVDINGTRLTTSAGGQDDGTPNNGGLITVGGLGDANTNPANPNASPVSQYSDDELYTLLPFITNVTTNILVNTVNPFIDDNIFLSYFVISGTAIVGEGIILSQLEDVNPVFTSHTVYAALKDVAGAPLPGMQVHFEVISGPNSGVNGNAITDVNGNAQFSYIGSGGVGFDEIHACFINSQQQQECSNVLIKEWIPGGEPTDVPLSDWALVIGIVLIVAATAFRFRRIS